MPCELFRPGTRFGGAPCLRSVNTSGGTPLTATGADTGYELRVSRVHHRPRVSS